ncbi:MAG: sulfur carrier protein ThiS [Oceanospirillaceae bacterium]|nr:sulfur carrier protein ThiS [Oceanospirillaceae bacterium]
MIKLTLNGKPASLCAGDTLIDLIRRHQLENRRIAVELNAEVVPRSRYGDVRLQPGDRIEIVHAIGGG